MIRGLGIILFIVTCRVAQASTINVSDYQLSGVTDSQAIQDAIDDAVSGDTVFFPGEHMFWTVNFILNLK